MKNLPLLIGSLVFTILLVIGVSILVSKKTNVPAVQVDAKLLLGDEAHAKGKKDAKVVVVEFSDLQCPACRAVQPLLDEVFKTYGEQIYFVYRHFPIRSAHVHAVIAARAAEAAHKQGKFFELHDLLFAKQTEWSVEKDPKLKFQEYAKELGLNVNQFNSDLENEKLDVSLLSDERDAEAIGVDATPAFFVNGYKTDASELFSKIDELLAK